MLIANPIYDTVFKYLMEDLEVAKGLLSTIIGEEIVEIEVQPQEVTTALRDYLVTILRLDFRAVIQTRDGHRKVVLIELQKGKYLPDIMRFRRYLGENYVREAAPIYGNKIKAEGPLPIITIYFLGFKLEGIDTPVLKVDRIYRDLITGKELKIKHIFVENLTHDSYIIQIPHLDPHTRTRLERLLMVFNQQFRTYDPHLLRFNIEADDPLLDRMVHRLAKAASTEEMRKQIIVEEEYEEALDNLTRDKKAAEEKVIEKDNLLKKQQAYIRQLEEKLKKQN